MTFNGLRFVDPVISEPWANERRDPDLPHTQKKRKGQSLDKYLLRAGVLDRRDRVQVTCRPCVSFSRTTHYDNEHPELEIRGSKDTRKSPRSLSSIVQRDHVAEHGGHPALLGGFPGAWKS